MPANVTPAALLLDVRKSCAFPTAPKTICGSAAGQTCGSGAAILIYKHTEKPSFSAQRRAKPGSFNLIDNPAIHHRRDHLSVADPDRVDLKDVI